MKKIITMICSLAILFTAAFAVVGCDLTGGNALTGGDENSAYAVSALTGASMLSIMDDNGSEEKLNVNNSVTTDKMGEGTPVRPVEMSDEVVDGIKNCLVMLESAVSDGKITQEIKLNDAEGEYSTYKYVMNVNAPLGHDIVMYYNELSKKEEVEIDDGKEEREIESDIAGVMIFNGNVYDVTGKHEEETDGDEKEVELTITTKSRINKGNYIEIKYENESEKGESEVSYKYKVFENGKLKQKSEVKFEEEHGKTQCKFKFETKGDQGKTEYKLTQNDNGELCIKYESEKTECKIDITRIEGGYRFTYKNGYSEDIIVENNI